MPDIQSAVTDIKPARSGRKPITLKNGKPLAVARAEARANHKTAKAAHRDAVAAHRNAVKAEKAAAKAHGAATKAQALVIAKPLPDKAAQKEALATAKGTVKGAANDLKVAQKATVVAEKAVNKALDNVTKTDQARLAVEQQYAALKAPTVN